MKLLFFVCILFLGVFSEKTAHYYVAEAVKELVRCKRPICNEPLDCAFGAKTDSKGCAVCECLQDPCFSESCETGYACDIIECRPGTKCDVLGFKCTRKPCKGPVPMCSNRCEYGYKLNDEGCDTCECRMSPSEFIDHGGLKPEENNEMYKIHNDAGSVDHKKFYDHSEDHDSDEKEKIDEDEEEEDHSDDGDEENKTSDDEKYFSLDLADPNAAICAFSCAKSHFCDVVQKDCKKRTKCWAHKELPKLAPYPYNSGTPSCDPVFWKFKPLQTMAGMRWCVDSLGNMIEETLLHVNAKKQNLVCKERLIESMTFTFIFEILSEGSGTEKLNDLIMKKVSELTTARVIDIEIVVSDYDKIEDKHMDVKVTLKYSNEYDLGYASQILLAVEGLSFKSDEVNVRQDSKALVTDVKKYTNDNKVTNIDIPWHNYFKENSVSRHLAHTNAYIRMVLFVFFIAMACAIFVLIVLMIYRLYKRSGTIRHHPVPNQLPATLDPSKLFRIRKDDKVLLVENDEIERARMA